MCLSPCYESSSCGRSARQEGLLCTLHTASTQSLSMYKRQPIKTCAVLSTWIMSCHAGAIAPDAALLLSSILYCGCLITACLMEPSRLRSIVAFSAAATLLYTPLFKKLTAIKNATVATVIALAPVAGALAAGAVSPVQPRYPPAISVQRPPLVLPSLHTADAACLTFSYPLPLLSASSSCVPHSPFSSAVAVCLASLSSG